MSDQQKLTREQVKMMIKCAAMLPPPGDEVTVDLARALLVAWRERDHLRARVRELEATRPPLTPELRAVAEEDDLALVLEDYQANRGAPWRRWPE